jgi:hypothetical protein
VAGAMIQVTANCVNVWPRCRANAASFRARPTASSLTLFSLRNRPVFPARESVGVRTARWWEAEANHRPYIQARRDLRGPSVHGIERTNRKNCGDCLKTTPQTRRQMGRFAFGPRKSLSLDFPGVCLLGVSATVQAHRLSRVLALHKRVPRAMDHHSSDCSPAEKFPTCASGRQGRGAVMFLSPACACSIREAPCA